MQLRIQTSSASSRYNRPILHDHAKRNGRRPRIKDLTDAVNLNPNATSRGDLKYRPRLCGAALGEKVVGPHKLKPWTPTF
jgi:hypothetical protein